MDMQLTGKTVIVTGASKGIGKAVATEFAREGATVLLASRNESALRKSVEDIKRETGNDTVDFAVCDMKDSKQIIELIEKAVAWKGTVDVLINNTGGPPAGLFSDMTDKDWYDAFELNLLSFIRTTREVIPHMKKQQSSSRASWRFTRRNPPASRKQDPYEAAGRTE